MHTGELANRHAYVRVKQPVTSFDATAYPWSVMEGYNHNSKVIATVHMSLAAVDFPYSPRQVKGTCQNDVIYIMNSIYSVVTRHSYVGIHVLSQTFESWFRQDYTN